MYRPREQDRKAKWPAPCRGHRVVVPPQALVLGRFSYCGKRGGRTLHEQI